MLGHWRVMCVINLQKITHKKKRVVYGANRVDGRPLAVTYMCIDRPVSASMFAKRRLLFAFFSSSVVDVANVGSGLIVLRSAVAAELLADLCTAIYV